MALMALVAFLVILAVAVIMACVSESANDNKPSKYSKIRHQASRTSNVKSLFKTNGNRFVAIDFETANDKYYSACSLGIVVFERQQPIERKTFLINPPTKFDPINISIHGLLRTW